MAGNITIREIDRNGLLSSLDELSDVLLAVVLTGASVGFILPFSSRDSRAFWNDVVLPKVSEGGRILLLAQVDNVIAGTVQLDIATPANQQHRGEIAKLMVHPDFRNNGIAKMLMVAIEQRARALGRTLLTLDTRTGDNAEPLYRSLGYKVAGIIPGYCRAPDEERYDSTTYMYKAL